MAFKESDSSDTVDMTEKFLFIKLVWPSAGESQIESYTKGLLH